MKKMLTKALAVFLSVLMCFTLAPFAFAEGESVENPTAPTFKIEIESETDEQVAVTLTLTENEFRCLDFSMSASENLVLEKIELNLEIFLSENGSGSGSSNKENGFISIARTEAFTAEFLVATYTYRKLTDDGVTANDFVYEIISCGLEGNVDVTDLVTVDMAIPEEHVHSTEGEWKETKAATCKEKGLEVRYCNICGEIAETRETDTTDNHSFDITDSVDATCDQPGYTRELCSICGAERNRVDYPAKNHPNTTTSHQDATCTEDGYDKTVCDDCGTVTSETVIKAKGHSEETETEMKLPTCTEDGYVHHKCTICGETVETETLKSSGHGYVPDVKTPTCTEDGYSRELCPSCGDTRYEVALAHSGHSWLDWKVITAPTYAKEGTERRICDNCGIDEERSVPKLVAKPTELTLNIQETGMNFRQTMRLFASVEPDEAAYSTEIIWESSDESVVTVNENGEVYAVGLGSATVTAKTADGAVSATCNITVQYSVLQWIIIYILFGWIWYI